MIILETPFTEVIVPKWYIFEWIIWAMFEVSDATSNTNTANKWVYSKEEWKLIIPCKYSQINNTWDIFWCWRWNWTERSYRDIYLIDWTLIQENAVDIQCYEKYIWLKYDKTDSEKWLQKIIDLTGKTTFDQRNIKDIEIYNIQSFSPVVFGNVSIHWKNVNNVDIIKNDWTLIATIDDYASKYSITQDWKFLFFQQTMRDCYSEWNNNAWKTWVINLQTWDARILILPIWWNLTYLNDGLFHKHIYFQWKRNDDIIDWQWISLLNTVVDSISRNGNWQIIIRDGLKTFLANISSLKTMDIKNNHIWKWLYELDWKIYKNPHPLFKNIPIGETLSEKEVRINWKKFKKSVIR
jgi:hypothetical protein